MKECKTCKHGKSKHSRSKYFTACKVRIGNRFCMCNKYREIRNVEEMKAFNKVS